MGFVVDIISLVDSTDRHAAALAQLGQFPVATEVHKFTRYPSLKHPCYDQKTRLERFGYDLLAGEIGCFDSHRKIWALAANRDVNTLILEDDFRLTGSDFFSLLASEDSKEASIIRLQGTFEKKYSVLESKSGFQVVCFEGRPAGTVAYFITPLAAKILLQASSKFYVSVDDFIDQEWRHGIIVKGLLPYPIFTTDDDSTIGKRKKPKFDICKKLQIEFFKGVESLKNRSFKRKKRKTIAQYKSTSPAGRVLNRR